MGDRTAFMRELLSPVRKTRSPARRSAAGPMRDFQVCGPLGRTPERPGRGERGERGEQENEVESGESELETDAMRLSTARPAPRTPGPPMSPRSPRVGV